MLDIFKMWLNTIIVTGILFTIIRIITPNTVMKKYVYSLIGVVTVIVILSPIIAIVASDTFESDVSQSLEDIITVETFAPSDYSEYEEISSNNVKENFKKKIEEDIAQKLKEKINQDTEVNVEISDTYNIDKVYITLTCSTSFDVLSYIRDEYDILEENIVVNKGG